MSAPTGLAVREALQADYARTLAQIDALTDDLAGMRDSAEASNADDEHDPEGATIAFERAQLVALIDQAQQRLRDLGRTVDQLDNGTYGVCERCGEPIVSERLQARPTATTCIRCAIR